MPDLYCGDAAGSSGARELERWRFLQGYTLQLQTSKCISLPAGVGLWRSRVETSDRARVCLLWARIGISAPPLYFERHTEPLWLSRVRLAVAYPTGPVDRIKTFALELDEGSIGNGCLVEG
ncbi:hypothetical protein EIP91_009968 [Steccherinum ochraceum]|uniref:Uncharacterized protein n=1 Tax=Steccherinum ochraceum TaxID=92696 RepID=A0A4R0R3N1_9APHY|nr:hypothetical protein EIP91_009968 [Steccherinum ochraceum]